MKREKVFPHASKNEIRMPWEKNTRYASNMCSWQLAFYFHERYSGLSDCSMFSISHLLVFYFFHLYIPFPTPSSFPITHLPSSSEIAFYHDLLIFSFEQESVQKLKLQIWLGSILQSKERTPRLKVLFFKHSIGFLPGWLWHTQWLLFINTSQILCRCND